MNQLTSSANAASLLGNRILLAAASIAACAAVALGAQFVEWGLAVAATLVLLGLAFGSHLLLGTATATRYVLTFVLFAFIALHIQLARGMTEMHFGIFVSLALLLVYRDWKVVVFGAAVAAVHHVAFDRLQAAGFGLYCTTQANFELVVVHALYVVVQTAVEVALARGLAKLAAEGEELRAMVERVNRPEGLALDAVAGQVVTTAGGKALQSTFARMSDVVRTVRDSAHSVDVASGEIAAGNDDLSKRTEQQASALQETSASVGQVNATVAASVDSARTANNLAQSACAVAEKGGATMQQVVQQMSGISESSRKIAEITSVIDAIAFQTNILALNASVEAARAGEQGRGFAVVATEVRNLAQRSADAAKEIKQLLSTSVDQVEAGHQLVVQAGQTMQEIVSSIRQVGSMVADISASGEQQKDAFAQVGSAVHQIDQATQQNAALVEQSAAAAASLRQQAKDLVEAVATFQLADQLAPVHRLTYGNRM